MPIQFPPSPALNQEYTYSGKVWAWDGSSWVGVRQETGIQKINIWAKQNLLIPKRGFGLNSGYNGKTDQRRTEAGTIPMLKHFIERDAGFFISNLVYEILTYTITGGVTVTNNGTDTVSIFRTSGSNSWDAQAYSSTSFTAPCTIEFNKQAPVTDPGNTARAMIGWNEDPTTNANYTSLDYASYPYQTSAYSVYHNASQVHSTGAWSTANKFYLVYEVDGTIKHYNGSTLLFTANYGAGKTVYVDTSIFSNNATNGGFSNVRVTKNAWNGKEYSLFLVNN
jgi:hypothetical protein